MATVKFCLQQPYEKGTKKLNERETRLYAFLIVDRDQVYKIKTKHVIYPSQWDFSRQRKDERVTGSIEFNLNLYQFKSDLLAKFEGVLKERTEITQEQMMEELRGWAKQIENPIKRTSIDIFGDSPRSVFNEFLSHLKLDNSDGTIKKFKSLQRNINVFIKENRRYNLLSFNQIDRIFLNAYRKYLKEIVPGPKSGRQKTRPEGTQNGLLLDTQKKYIESLKTFLRWSEENGYNKNAAYRKFEAVEAAARKRVQSNRKANIIALTLPELIKLYNHDFSKNQTLERARDLFCFGAFTGQRWEDWLRFDKSQLDGDTWIFEAAKTKKQTVIFLVGYSAPALDILRKYNHQLPITSSQKFNTHIKEAAQKAGIIDHVKLTKYVGAQAINIEGEKWEFVSAHTARKTCLSILLNEYNMPISHVQDISGHSDLKTLQKYISRNDQARREAMSRITPITEVFTVKKSAV